MLRLALMFFIVALVAALFGFGGLAAATAGLAQFVFVTFFCLFVAALVFDYFDRRDPSNS